MDLKALMQKLETINTKQIVKESVETKQVITESVARRVVKESADPVFKGSIARGLVEEFGYEIEESTLTENPHANDPAKSAAWAALSPEDQKWLGGADPTDPYILARAPNKGKPAAPAAAAPAAAAPAADQGAATKPAAEEPAAPTIDPAKLKRFQELLAKASAPAAPKTESVSYEDDQTLLAIKNIRY